MRCSLAATALCLCLCSAPAHAGRVSPDLYFAGDRYRAAATEGQRKARPAKIRKARVVHRRKPAARVAVAARPAKPRLALTVPVAPLDAPEVSQGLALLGRFVAEVFSIFPRPTAQEVRLRIPYPVRDEVFARAPEIDPPKPPSRAEIRQNPKAAPSLVARAEAFLGMTARQIGVRTSLWCAAFMNKITGGGTGSDMARSYASWGKPAKAGCTNCVAVLSRGRNPANGHVGVVKSYDRRGNPVIVSGNHGGRVATAVYPKRRVIAWRVPGDAASFKVASR